VGAEVGDVSEVEFFDGDVLFPDPDTVGDGEELPEGAPLLELSGDAEDVLFCWFCGALFQTSLPDTLNENNNAIRMKTKIVVFGDGDCIMFTSYALTWDL